MKRTTQTLLAMCLAVFGTALQARADCQSVSGNMTETIVPTNDPYGRTLGIVTGVLNGVSTAVVTSADGSTSSDIIVTNRGDILTGTGAVAVTPIVGSSDFSVNVTLTVTGGSGKYSGATGKLTYIGLAQFPTSTTGTFNLVYRGSVCGSNVKANGD
jgi:hypothetical protein